MGCQACKSNLKVRALRQEQDGISQAIERIRQDENKLAYSFDPSHGKGSHGRVTVGKKYTTVKKGEFGPGLYRKMLSDLGIDKEEF